MKFIDRILNAINKKQIDRKLRSLLVSLLPGMRVIKTVIAIFLCWMIGLFIRGNKDLVDAPIAAVLVMQTSVESSIKLGLLRLLGTLLAGFYAVLMIEILIGRLSLEAKSLPFLALASLSLLPFSLFLITANLHRAMATTMLVFIVIIANAKSDANVSAALAVNRVINTAVGVAVATFINWLPILNREAVDEEALINGKKSD